MHCAEWRRIGGNTFYGLLAGFNALLYRHTGQQDIRVGVPIANRNRVETAGLIGFFVNTQVLRSEIHGRMALADVLDQVREAAIDAQACQDLPFEQLVEALQPERSLSHSPLFQVTINHLLRDYRALQQLPGLTMTGYDLAEQAAQFELILETIESPDGGVRASFIHASELFDPRPLSDWLGTTFIYCGCWPGSRSDLLQTSICLAKATRQQLRAWGIHDQRFAATQPVHQLIERQAEKCPDAVAVIFDSTELSYAELNRRSNRLAHRLIDLGVKPEVRVGIAVERSIEMIVGLLAILKAGGGYVPFDPEYPRDRLNYMMEDSDIQLAADTKFYQDTHPAHVKA